MRTKHNLLRSVFVVVGLCGFLAAASACRSRSNRACSTVLDEDTLNRLALSLNQSVAMRPGEKRTFSLGVVEY